MTAPSISLRKVWWALGILRVVIKVGNHLWAIALHYMHYNFCRIHQTLRATPAIEAGIADHVWLIEEAGSSLDRRVKVEFLPRA